MTKLLLVGTDTALLEGLAQSFGALGRPTRLARSLHDAREQALAMPPLVAVVERSLAALSISETMGLPLAPGGALVLFASALTPPVSLNPALQRAVLADLALPLERKRLMALVNHVEERARATGRDRRPTPPERPAVG